MHSRFGVQLTTVVHISARISFRLAEKSMLSATLHTGSNALGSDFTCGNDASFFCCLVNRPIAVKNPVIMNTMTAYLRPNKYADPRDTKTPPHAMAV